MKNKNNILFLVLASLLFSSCGGFKPSSDPSPKDDPDVPVTGQGYLKISQQTTDLLTTDYIFVSNRSYQFWAKGKTDDGKNADYTNSATWSSSDRSIFIVDSMGRVSALSNGTATLKAVYGDYSDEIEVKVTTPATSAILVEEDILDEYRTTKTYDLPVYIKPQNAFVACTCSIEGGCEFLENNQFIPKKDGEMEITVRTFINDAGKSKFLKFTINPVNNDAPYFKYKDEVKESVAIDVAINKYQELSITELGIKAYAGNDDSDISSNITLKSGSYDLKTLGKYDLVYTVSNLGVFSDLNVELNIVEREEVMTKIDVIKLPIDSLRIYVSTINYLDVTLSMSSHLPSDYEKYFGDVSFYAEFEIKHKVNGNIRELFKKSMIKYIDKTSSLGLSQSETFRSPELLRGGDSEENYVVLRQFIEFHGYGFNYITYPPQE